MDLVSNKVDTGGKRLNLFPAKKQKKKLPVDDKVFNMMEAVADKSYVNISDMSQLKVEKSTKSIHNALMVAGMTPAYGNIADVADATLYALEGEFGEAAWSMAAAIPVIGQMVAGRRVAKVAKEAGEEMVTLYRGVNKGFKDTMVSSGKVVGNPKLKGYKVSEFEEIFPNTTLFTSTSKKTADAYKVPHHFRGTEFEEMYRKKGLGEIIEFEVPNSFIKDNALFQADEVIFKEGIPIEFLKKVHK
jgi:hypothetical protein